MDNLYYKQSLDGMACLKINGYVNLQACVTLALETLKD